MSYYWKLTIGLEDSSPYFECRCETKQMAINIVNMIDKGRKDGVDRLTYPNIDYPIILKRVWYQNPQSDDKQ
jgi:hypothetical protein